MFLRSFSMAIRANSCPQGVGYFPVMHAWQRLPASKPMADAGDPELHPESPWGMGVYLYRYGAGAEMDRAASLAQAAGVKWSREEFSWGRIETQPGLLEHSFYVICAFHRCTLPSSKTRSFSTPYRYRPLTVLRDTFCRTAICRSGMPVST